MKKKCLLVALALTASLFSSCSCSSNITKGSYKLTLDAVGGTFSDGNDTKEYANSGTVNDSSALETPTKESDDSYSYTFAGWYDGKGDSANKINFPYTLSKDTTFYSHWTSTALESHNVTLNANGGTFDGGQTVYTLEKITKLKESDLGDLSVTNGDRQFLGWFYSTTGEDDSVEFPLKVKKDITIYARWSDDSEGYTVNIDPDGGTFTDGTSSKILKNQYVIDFSKLDHPSKDNYIFLGYGDSTGSTSIRTGKLILSGNKDIYAVYRDKTSRDFAIVSSNGGKYTKDGNTYTLSSAGTYDVYGDLADGQIYVDAGEDDDVDINLNDCSITSSSSMPIYAEVADSVKIKAVKDTSNYIYDNRSPDNETDGGAIYADCDLSFAGKGSLHIEGNGNNGIHSEKDVSIKNLSLYCRGYNNGIRGEHSITIESGDIQVVAKNGDGLKTTDNGLTSKSKQKGNIEITGGNIDIDAYQDGISSAYNVLIESSASEGTSPTLDIKTNKYAVTGGEEVQTSTMYIRSKTKYSGNVYLYSYNSDSSSGTSAQAEYVGTETEEGGGPGGRPGQQTTYYVYKVDRPTDKTNFQIRIGSSATSYSYSTRGDTFNNSYNMVTLSSSGSSTLSVSWGNHDSDISCKGIKAENKIIINEGSVINIESYDDAIRANGDEKIESTSSYGEGIVYINGGTINISTDDKGIHADNYLYVNGGETTISTSYEGFEAAQITIAGGLNKIYATDDGINAAVKDSTVTTKLITVTGGITDIQVGDGDTDGIDSNGNYVQTGGIVISRASSNNQMSTGLDTDGTASVTGTGVLVCLGAQNEPARENKMTASNKSENTSKSVSSGTHTLTISGVSDQYQFNAIRSYTGLHLYWGSNIGTPSVS